jgi:hypothetical protein
MGCERYRLRQLEQALSIIYAYPGSVGTLDLLASEILDRRVFGQQMRLQILAVPTFFGSPGSQSKHHYDWAALTGKSSRLQRPREPVQALLDETS